MTPPRTLLLALVLPACASLGATGRTPGVLPPVCDASHDIASEPDAPPEGSFDVAFIPSFDHVWVAGATADQRHVVVGGMRATLNNERITWARDLFAAEVIAAIACDGGWLFVARDGARAMAASFTGDLATADDELGACVAPSPEPADTALRATLTEALLFRRPHWLFGHSDAVLWSRMQVLLRSDGEAAFQLLHASDASVVRSVESDLGDCTPERWGNGLALVCPGGTVIRDVRASVPETVPVPAGLRPLLLSDDGEHILAAGNCSGGRGSGYCVRTEPGWQPFVTPAFGVPTWIAMHGPRALATLQPMVGPARLTLQGGETGSCTVPIEGQESLEGWSLSRVDWTRDGVIVALGVPADGDPDAPVLLTGRPHEGLSALPLPPRVHSARLLDANRGVAAGTTAAGLWRTSDGGRTWSRISLPVDGTLDSISLTTRVRDGQPVGATDGHGGPSIECSDGQCLIGGQILVRGWSGSVTAEQRIFTRD